MGKGKLGPNGYEISSRAKTTRGTLTEVNATNNKLVKENNLLRNTVEEQAEEIEGLKAVQDALMKGDEGKKRQDAIFIALELLDHSNDEHWTDEGKPRMEAVCTAMGDDTVTREEVEALGLDFTRTVDPS